MKVMYQQAGRLGSALIGIAFSAFADVAQPAPSTADAVRARGQSSRGVPIDVVGVALPDAHGNYGGLDVDTCRAVAAAVLVKASQVRFIPTPLQVRFTALQSGEADCWCAT